MSYSPKELVPQQYVESSATLKYTSPANGKGTWIDYAAFANNDAATQTVTVYIIPSGGSAGLDTKVIPALSLAAGAFNSAPGLASRFLAPGTAIQWSASVASKVNGTITGREVS